MVPETKKLPYSHFSQILTTILFLLLAAWWVYSFFYLRDYNNLLWGATYQIVAVVGVISGLIVSRQWGGYKSLLGRAVLFFSLGLVFQVFGQSVFSFYNLVAQVDIPYPSIADIGYFGSIPLYIYATALLLRVSGGTYSLQSFGYKFLAIVLPMGMLIFSYLFFLKGYVFDWDYPLGIILDFGYPLGQAVYVSIAVLTYILSKRYLGGIMKNSIIVILLALVVQYIADYNFLFQAYRETWINGGYGDFLYLLAYFVLTMGLIMLGHAFQRIKES
jgi:hypothetical protein